MHATSHELERRQHALLARGDWRAVVRLYERAVGSGPEARDHWRRLSDVLESRVLHALDEADDRLALLFELGRIARDELGDRERLSRFVAQAREAAALSARAERLAHDAMTRERRWLLARARTEEAIAHLRHQMIATRGGLGAMAALAGEAMCDFIGSDDEVAWALSLSACWIERPDVLSGLDPTDRAALLLSTLGTCRDAAAVGNPEPWRELRGYVLAPRRWLHERLHRAVATQLVEHHRQLRAHGGLERALRRLERAYRQSPLDVRLVASDHGLATSAATRLHRLEIGGLDFGLWTDVGGPLLWVVPR